jgi:signal transduction histidine kinase
MPAPTRDGNGVRFSIADDGAGADALARGDGMGVIGMRDRMGAVGGEVEVTSALGHGTTVRGTAPDLPPDTSAEPADRH